MEEDARVLTKRELSALPKVTPTKHDAVERYKRAPQRATINLAWLLVSVSVYTPFGSEWMSNF